MAYADLHLHTVFSDGVVTPREQVIAAAGNGVGVMAITDHDNTRGLDEAFVAAEKAGVKMIAGTEISTTWYGSTIHLAAYGFDRKNINLAAFLETNCEKRKQVFANKIEALAPGLVDEFILFCGSFFNRHKAVDFLVDKGISSDAETALNALRTVKFEVDFSSPEEAIEMVHRAGGVVVLAHPFSPQRSLKPIDPSPAGQRKLVAELAAQKLDGLECYQASHAPADIAYALELASDFGLMVSAGSDWHGPISVLGEGVRRSIPFYVNNPGGLKTSLAAVAPFLERLGIAVDKTPRF